MSNKKNFRPFASFRGLRNVLIVAVSANALFPELFISDAGIDLRVMRRHHLNFDEIESVTYGWRLAYQVTLVPKSGPFTFSFNYLVKAEAKALLRDLDRKGLALSARARSVMAGDQA